MPRFTLKVALIDLPSLFHPAALEANALDRDTNNASLREAYAATPSGFGAGDNAMAALRAHSRLAVNIPACLLLGYPCGSSMIESGARSRR